MGERKKGRPHAAQFQLILIISLMRFGERMDGRPQWGQSSSVVTRVLVIIKERIEWGHKRHKFSEFQLTTY